jgi:hypothetical protein
VFGQFTREDESDRGLDFSRRDGGFLIISSELGGFGGHALEDVWGGSD